MHERAGVAAPLVTGIGSKAMKATFLLGSLAVVLAMTGAIQAQTSQQVFPLEGTWYATELAGKPTPKPDPNRETYLQFESGGRISGSDGCNRLTGTYQLDGERVAFGQMASTQMLCLNSSGTEDPFRDALKNATRLTVTRERMELFDATGTRLAVFSSESPASVPHRLRSGSGRLSDRT